MSFERYRRQLLIEEIGEKGQQKIHDTRIGVVGAGGLGSIIIPQLIASGFGTIRIFEGDRLTLTNLNRQTIYREEDIGKKKADALQERVSGLNSEVKVEIIPEFIEYERQVKYFKDLDIVIDATDNIQTRLLLDRFTQVLNIPLIHGAVSGMIGQIGVFIPPRSLQKLFGNTAKKQKVTPAYAPICGVIGSLQVNEAIRIAVYGESPLNGKILVVDLAILSLREVSVE